MPKKKGMTFISLNVCASLSELPIKLNIIKFGIFPKLPKIK